MLSYFKICMAINGAINIASMCCKVVPLSSVLLSKSNLLISQELSTALYQRANANIEGQFDT